MGKISSTWGGRFLVEERNPTWKERLHQLIPRKGLCRAEIDNRRWPNAVERDGVVHARCCLSDTHGHESEMGEGHYYPGTGYWFSDSRFIDESKEKHENAKGTR